MLKSLQRRLAKAEQRGALIARRRKPAGCICDNTFFVVHGPEQFETEINRPCPAHGFRRLSDFVVFVPDEPERTRLEELMAAYEARLAKSEQELADAS